MKTKRNFKELNDMRQILYVYYLHYGRPAGVTIEQKTSVSGNPYIQMLNAPYAHQGAAKSILKEIYGVLGSYQELDQEFWSFFGSIVHEAKKRGCHGIYDIRDRFPNLFSELGGIGNFRIPRICKSKRLEYLPDRCEIHNDGVRVHLVKDMGNPEQVYDSINERYYKVKDLLILE